MGQVMGDILRVLLEEWRSDSDINCRKAMSVWRQDNSYFLYYLIYLNMLTFRKENRIQCKLRESDFLKCLLRSMIGVHHWFRRYAPIDQRHWKGVVYSDQ